MSLIDQQKELEYYPDEVLAQEMMQPTGIAPSFLVATEIKRRNDMRNAYQAQMNQPPQMSVAEEEAMELQGIPNADPNAMQQQMMQEPMPQQQMPQGAPMQMREGGAVRYQEGGSPLIGRGGTLLDWTNPWDYALAGMMFAPIPGSRLAASAIKAGRLGKAAAQAKGIKGLGKIGEYAIKLGFNPSYGGAKSITTSEVGKQALKYPIRYVNPKATEFRTRTLPAVGGAGLLAGVGGEDSGIGTESNASIIEDVNAADAVVDPRLEGKSLDEIAAIKSDDNRQRQALAEKLAADKAAEDAERDRRAALPDSARMLEDAMANVPENETFQDYLSTLEGMEESRKGQILMDLGAAIANASHGGDIAKGFQEAGTKARAEQIEVAKERARVLGESRAMDINTSLKMAEIDAALMKSDQITLSGWLDLFADNPDLIQAVEDADDPIAEIIKILSRLGVNTDNMEAITKETGTK
jgi:hypothetical protein